MGSITFDIATSGAPLVCRARLFDLASYRQYMVECVANQAQADDSMAERHVESITRGGVALTIDAATAVMPRFADRFSSALLALAGDANASIPAMAPLVHVETVDATLAMQHGPAGIEAAGLKLDDVTKAASNFPGAALMIARRKDRKLLVACVLRMPSREEFVAIDALHGQKQEGPRARAIPDAVLSVIRSGVVLAQSPLEGLLDRYPALFCKQVFGHLSTMAGGEAEVTFREEV